MTDKTSKTTDINGSQVGVAGDNAEIKGDVNIKRDEITAEAKEDAAVATGNAIATIIKDIKIHFQQKPIITTATALLLVIIFAILGFLIWFWTVPPRFVLAKSILRSDAPIIIKATNWQADKNRLLDVEFDEIRFRQQGIPILSENTETMQSWQFTLTDQLYTQDMMNEGYHRIRVGFSDANLSCSDQEGCKIVFMNRPPDIGIETTPGLEPDSKIIKGKAVSEVQLPDNKISVEIFYYHDGPAQKIDVPVKVKEDSETGITYFEFETSIQGLPHISPGEPGYSDPFFAFKITDMAGNSYFQEQSYAQYMAPGSNRFGFEGLALLKVKKLEKDDEFRNIISLTPAQIPIQTQLLDGKPAIILSVVGKTLKWRSNVKNRLPVTVVFLDEKQVGTSLTDEYKLKEQPADLSAEVRVEQEDEKGVKYTSNTVKTSGSVDEIDSVITSSIGAKFVYIEPGSFMMGSPEDEKSRNKDEKQHKVTLSKGFYMQTTEVTQGQWKSVMGEYPPDLRFKDCGDDCPVERVSWNDIQVFISKLKQMDNMTYRLPTEAEWEYACRAGTSTPYYTGDKVDDLKRAGWYSSNSGSKTHPVGKKEANKWGLYDMHGNVWEWCQDWFDSDYYSKSPTADPTGPKAGSARVIRGGSWLIPAQYCRSACRFRRGPGGRDRYLGFRLVFLPGQP